MIINCVIDDPNYLWPNQTHFIATSTYNSAPISKVIQLFWERSVKYKFWMYFNKLNEKVHAYPLNQTLFSQRLGLINRFPPCNELQKDNTKGENVWSICQFSTYCILRSQVPALWNWYKLLCCHLKLGITIIGFLATISMTELPHERPNSQIGILPIKSTLKGGFKTIKDMPAHWSIGQPDF